MPEEDDRGISARTATVAAAERAAEAAADAAEARRRRSLRGRAERVARWVRNPRTGPVARARRVARVVVDIARAPGALPELPRSVLAAARAPSLEVAPPRPAGVPIGPARAAARTRLEGFQQAGRGSGGRLRLAVIADPPFAAEAALAGDVVAVRPEDWRDVLTATPPDVLVVESAWRGNDGAWQYRIAWTAHPDGLGHRDLRPLLAWCAERGIPSVFWHTGSAAAVPRFREAAALCDLVVADAPAADAFAAMAERRGAGVVPSRLTVAASAAGPVADRLRTEFIPGAGAAP